MVLVGALCLGSTHVEAQDLAFSQFYIAPLNINPAFIGIFQGKYRATALYRSQWQNAVGDGSAKSLYAGLDLRFPITRSENQFAGSLMVTHDNSGTGSFASSQVQFAGAYHKSLDYYGNNIIGVGFMVGYQQRSLVYDRLTFGDSYDGGSAYSTPTNENLPRNNFSFWDLGVGGLWMFKPNKKTHFHLGLAAHHFNSPNVALHQIDPNPVSIKLPIKLTAHTGLTIKTGGGDKYHTDIMPRAAFIMQGETMHANIGTGLRMALSHYNNPALHIGAYGRFAKYNTTGFGFDALTILAGMEFGSFTAGISYDFYINDYTLSGPKRSIFELSLSFIGEYEDEDLSCPKF